MGGLLLSHRTSSAGAAPEPRPQLSTGRLRLALGMVEPSPGDGAHFVLIVKQPVIKASP